jgi:heptosyltransferase-1
MVTEKTSDEQDLTRCFGSSLVPPRRVTRHCCFEMRFLIVRLSSIGDIVHALPAVAALGEAFPHAEISWAIEKRHAILLDGNPYVRRVICLDTLGWRSRPTSRCTLEDVVRSVLALRELAFDAAIDFQGLVKSGLIAWISRSQERLGFAENWLREPAARAFYTDCVSPRDRRHVIEMNLALVERLGVPALQPRQWRFPLPHSASDEQVVSERLAALGVEEFIIINPGGGWISKRWSPGNYAELLQLIEQQHREHGWRILLTGSPDEEALIREVLERAGSKQAVYFASTLAEFIALVHRAKLFLGGDTGPLHLAAAVGTPIVAIYGPTDWVRNGPFSAADITLSNAGPIDHTRRARKPTFLPGVAVESVFGAILERVEREHG